MRSTGTLLCIGSAAAFGAMAVLGKLAYDNGATVGTLLAVRFALAAAVFWALVFTGGGAAAELRALVRRDVAIALGLGAVGYAAQACCFFAALERIDASLLSLMLYTFPAMVAVAAIVLGRERADATRFGALGAALALGAATIYTAYILVSQGIAGRIGPTLLSALVCTGASVTLSAGSALLGDLRPTEVTAAGWGWLAGIAVVSTVAAVSLFFAGLKRVGPTTASILSTVEPVVTVVLAFLVFGELLSSLQLLGGALVIAAVIVLGSHRPRETAEVPA